VTDDAAPISTGLRADTRGVPAKCRGHAECF
jgi:hypothetical protein